MHLRHSVGIVIGRLSWSMGLAILGLSGWAQVTPPDQQIQAVYGGRVSAINTIELASQTNTVRIFAATESANSVFYGDVNHALTAPYATNNFRFRVVPDFDAQANFGQVSGIAGHPASGKLFVADDYGLFSCDPTTAGTLITNIVGQTPPASPLSAQSQPGEDPPPPPPPSGARFLRVAVEDSTLMAIGNVGNSNKLYFGALDASGNFTQGTGSPINIGPASTVNTRAIAVHPINRAVYIFDCDSTNGLVQSSTAYDALSAATTFAPIALPAELVSWVSDKVFGIAPDGRLFIAGTSGGYKTLIYSDNNGASWTTVNTGLGGAVGGNVESAGDTNFYQVYFGSIVSTNKGVTGSWQGIGQYGTVETHPNDGVVIADAFDPRVAYVTTDQGIGASTNGGHDLFEIDYGLEAVQIQGFDMTAAKTVAWTASKSGIRRGMGFPDNPQWTPNGIFPLFDGSPYYSVTVSKHFTDGNVVLAANARIYKTSDSGTNWIRLWNIDGNTNGFSSSGYFAALLVAWTEEDGGHEQMMAGFYDPNNTRGGGVLASVDGGSNWMQIMRNVSVNALLYTVDLAADTTPIYVGVAYDATTGSGGVYQITFGMTGSTILHDLTNAVSIRSLAQDSDGGIYASGCTTNNATIVYYRDPVTGAWSALTSMGLPPPAGGTSGRGAPMTIGRDSDSNEIPVIASGVNLYYLPDGGTQWMTSTNLAYPDGTQINVLYWDDLMVGTDNGLFGQVLRTESATTDLRAGDYDGDHRADPAVYQGTNWYIWMSSAGYTPQGPFPFGAVSATPVVGDFDGDGMADPTVYTTNNQWVVWMSRAGYAPAGPFAFSVSGATPAPADFDGDGAADPTMFMNGYWLIWMSSGGYAPQGPFTFGYPNTTPVPADYDGDQRADPAVFADGYWMIWMSGGGYQALGPLQFGIPNTLPVPADFDDDGKADPAVVLDGSWYIWMSGGGYQMSGPYIFTM